MLTILSTTGMQNSDFKPWLCCLTMAALAVAVRADELALAGDARLSGEVRAIDANGVVELVSALAPEPLRLKPDGVRKITFAERRGNDELPGGLVELVNGDLLPATITELNDDRLKVVTPDVGELEIARGSLKSIQLGVHTQKLLYRGPNSQEEWSKEMDGARNWQFRRDTLTANGPAVAMREIKVPEQFVLRFHLKWKSAPSFTVYFADPMKDNGNKVDRYFMQFSASGIEVKRESSQGEKLQSIILLNREPDDFPTHQVDVELRVDRRGSKIHLLLNGEPEASGVDPVDTAPIGSGIVFVSSSATSATQEINDIEVLDFDDARERHHSEDRGDLKTDSMISRDEDRWGGRLKSIRPTADGPLLTFESDFQEQPLELRGSDVSTVFFARSGDAPESDGQDSWIVRLRGGGALHVTSCVISDDRIAADHPLLGALNIRRDGVVAIERLAMPNEPKKEDAE